MLQAIIKIGAISPVFYIGLRIVQNTLLEAPIFPSIEIALASILIEEESCGSVNLIIASPFSSVSKFGLGLSHKVCK